MELREKMIDTAISVYNKALYEKPIGSYSYEDCIGLAFDDNLSLTYGIYKENSKALDKDNFILSSNSLSATSSLILVETLLYKSFTEYSRIKKYVNVTN